MIRKYLGMSEGLSINGPDLKKPLQERFFGNKVRASNGWVMPVLMYFFGILKWTQTELDAWIGESGHC